MHIAPGLNHVNLMTHDMDRLIRFYGDVLGFKPGYRPPFSVAGSGLYLGEHALIHLVQTSAPVRNDDPAVNHFALTGDGLAGLLPRARTARLRTVRLGHQPQSEWPDWGRSMHGNVRKARLAALRAFRRIGRCGLSTGIRRKWHEGPV